MFKLALHTLIERITDYPDWKIEVKYRIEGKLEGTHEEQYPASHELQYPLGSRYKF